MIILIATAAASPLLAPRCTPGTSASWEVRREVSGRSHGRHADSGEEIDRPIEIRQQQRVTLRCLSDAPARVALTLAYPDGSGGWAARPERITLALPEHGVFAVERVEPGGVEPAQAALWQRRDALREPLAWIFPPLADGDAWEGPWPIEAGPWWGCRVSIAAQPDGTLSAEGGCDEISYQGHSRLSGTLSRSGDGLGVQEARWVFDSVWEHYMVYTDTTTTVTVTRLLEER